MLADAMPATVRVRSLVPPPIGAASAALLTLALCVSGCANRPKAAADTRIELQTLRSASGVMSCKVPASWASSIEKNNTVIAWDPQGVSGTLRISMITLKKSGNDGAGNPAREVAAPVKEGERLTELPNGTVLKRQRTVSSEDGVPIAMQWFHLTNYLPPRYFRIAMISFTTTLAEEKDARVQQQLAVLEHELPGCRFAPEPLDWER